MMTTSANIKELNSSNFRDTLVSGLNVVEFWAAWCTPCRIQSPIIDNLADKFGDRVNFFTINVEEYPNLASIYDVMNIPTIIIFKNGESIKKYIGIQNENTIYNELKDLLI